jgi:SRSO17 transposase
VVVSTGWVLSTGPRAVTESLVVTGVSGVVHHEAFHRFFSRARWYADELGRLLFRFIVSCLDGGEAIVLAIDDTVAPKKGEKVYGLGTHIDPVRSTRKHRIFCFGHCWVVLALLVRVPFASRPWALPVLFRLYRTKKECARSSHPYRKKTELAREMLELIAEWSGDRRVEVCADSAYCNGTVTAGLPERFVLFGRLRLDAVLTAAPEGPSKPGRGRPRLKGAPLPKPLAVARDKSVSWGVADAQLYGRDMAVRFKEFTTQWYRACGTRLLSVVVIETTTGSVPYQAFFSTDPSLSAVGVLQGYARRWSIECAFRDMKQLLGFADSQARSRLAVERTAPFIGLLFSLLVIWFAQGAWRQAVVPTRPWYPHKKNLSFADVMRTARVVLEPYAEYLASSLRDDDLEEIGRRGSRAHPPPGRSARDAAA